MDISVPTICLWIPYMLDTAIPGNATMAGCYSTGHRTKSYPTYVARAYTIKGKWVPVGQFQSSSHYAVSFPRGTGEFLTAVSLRNKTGELLACRTDVADLRWVKFSSLMDLSSCIPYGAAESGEIGYVGRTFAKGRGSYSKTYGFLPGLFVPSDGFITVYAYGIVHSTDVEVLCVIWK